LKPTSATPDLPPPQLICHPEAQAHRTCPHTIRQRHGTGRPGRICPAPNRAKPTALTRAVRAGGLRDVPDAVSIQPPDSSPPHASVHAAAPFCVGPPRPRQKHTNRQNPVTLCVLSTCTIPWISSATEPQQRLWRGAKARTIMRPPDQPLRRERSTARPRSRAWHRSFSPGTAQVPRSAAVSEQQYPRFPSPGYPSRGPQRQRQTRRKAGTQSYEATARPRRGPRHASRAAGEIIP
jgi:hypothetical protein